ncbi:MAG: ATP-binding cassette domain-containing protein [Magnetococcales bacterium]|nr:ATP-binding cassette domain-containing protein [Magnetococcales bacterium]
MSGQREHTLQNDLFQPETDLASCLLPLLDALGWRGSQSQLFEALPHQPNSLSMSDLLNVLASLKFASKSINTSLDKIDHRLLPCLFVPKNESAMVLLKGAGSEFLAYNGVSGGFSQLAKKRVFGEAFFFQAVKIEQASLLTKQKDWFHIVLARFSNVMMLALIISCLLSLIALASPLFVKTVYDQVLAGRSVETLYLFVSGAGIFFFAESLFRFLRTNLLGFVSVRLSNIVGTELLRRILFLPAAFTEAASLGAQVSRIRDFETIRDFFSGPAVVALFELPFVTLLLLGMYFLTGPLTYVPIAAIVLFIVLGLIIFPLIQRTNSKTSSAVSKKKQFLVEMLSNVRAIKYTGTRSYWLNRYKQLSAEAAMHSFLAGNVTTLVNTLSQTLVTVAGLITVAVGVLSVLEGNLTMGGLMAAMLLVWRILAPLRTGFGVLTQVGKIYKSIEQVNRLMNMRMERNIEAETNVVRHFKGVVTFNQVSIRYTSDAHPALLGVNFNLNHGESLLVVGHDGAGKSTILKLILGMYHPQAGRVLIDNQNVQQIEPQELRRGVGYAPQSDTFFYGQISQNMRLADPAASNERLRQAAEKVGLLEEIEALSDGFDTRIGDNNIAQLSASFQRRLSLARVLLKESSILLFDEPERGLNAVQENKLIATLKELKGEKTVILTSPRTRYFAIADYILWLDNGRVRDYGPKKKVIPAYLKAMAKS